MNRTTKLSLLVATLVGLAALPAAAENTTFRFFPGGLNQAIFQSEAPLETITGTSNGIRGEVSVDLANPSNASGHVTIDAASFRTGIDLRDEHLRSPDWIDASSHPEIRFELTGVTIDGPLEAATPRTATVTGNLTFHGQTQAVTTSAEVGYYEVDAETRANPMLGLTGNALRIEATFSLTLADYGIAIPPMLNLKVAEVVTIEMRLTGIDSWPEEG